MTPLTWKAAITGGALVGLGLGGFALADDGRTDREPVDSVKLRQASVDAARLSAPVTVAPATTVAAAVDPAPIAAPTTAAPAPAPAPAAADSPHTADTPVPPAAPQPASVDSPASPPEAAPDSPGTGASGGS